MVLGTILHPVHVFLHIGTFCLVELLIIASKLYCIVCMYLKSSLSTSQLIYWLPQNIEVHGE